MSWNLVIIDEKKNVQGLSFLKKSELKRRKAAQIVLKKPNNPEF